MADRVLGAPASRLASLPADRLHLYLMQILTFTTGINDAIGYLGLDRVFTGNMTGNVVVLGMALTGKAGLPVLGPLLALLGFIAGAAIGGRALKGAVEPWSATTSLAFAATAVMLGLVGAGLLIAGHPSHAGMVAATTVAALAMGLQAAAARTIAVEDVTTVVVTSTITGLAADSFLGNGTRTGSSRRGIVVLMLLAGSAVGVLLLQVALGLGLIVAAVIIGAVTALGDWHRRSSTSAVAQGLDHAPQAPERG